MKHLRLIGEQSIMHYKNSPEAPDNLEYGKGRRIFTLPDYPLNVDFHPGKSENSLGGILVIRRGSGGDPSRIPMLQEFPLVEELTIEPKNNGIDLVLRGGEEVCEIKIRKTRRGLNISLIQMTNSRR